MKKIAFAILVLSMAFAGSAFAANLSGVATTDDAFELYLSSSALGPQPADLIGTKVDQWASPLTFSNVLLNTPGTYYLQVKGWDLHQWVAGVLGTFTLTGNATFQNGQKTLSTNTTDWKVGNSWAAMTDTPTLSTLWQNGSGVLQPATSGLNGSQPWGTIGGISSAAGWIWTNNGQDLTSTDPNATPLTRYFTTKITVTPEPVSLVLFGLGAGVLGLTKLRRKKAQ